ncbi:hypothetical protein BVY04_03695 [bacterium M21]|nr:hypothetical protein BVY04_03695 [bacterium M21]
MRYTTIAMLLLETAVFAGTPRHIRNSDYSEPRGKATFLYAAITIDNEKWPAKTEIGISKFGFIFVMECVAGETYRFTPFLLQPHEQTRLVSMLHDIIPAMLKSRPSRKNQSQLLRAEIGYSQPSLSLRSICCYSDIDTDVTPLLAELKKWQRKARERWAAEIPPGKGEKAIASLKTKDPQFLQHMMNTLHNVHTWRKEETTDSQKDK